MRIRGYPKTLLKLGMATALLFLSSTDAHGQTALNSLSEPSSAAASPDARSTASPVEVQMLAGLIRDLQTQVEMLTSQLSELRTEQRQTGEEARQLRIELDLAKARVGVPKGNTARLQLSSTSASVTSSSQIGPPEPQLTPQEQATSERLAKLEENQELIEGKVNDEYQTKVESGSKYRVRLSGIVLLNLFDNRGTVDNIDFPQLAQKADPLLYSSPGTFGGTVRQSQFRIQAFGPDIAGAHTSADIAFDFAGGFSNTWNGVALGVMRLRTGTMRLDWTDTSLVAGQDHLFFAPLAPTSLASFAQPALSYTGNLWAWTPQVRIEHRVILSDASSLMLQGGILDSLTGDPPFASYERYPAWGEMSGQPAYAVRVAWTHKAFGQNLTVGFGGYYGRQNWGFNRNVDGWAGTTDVTLPLGRLFEFTGEFYRGRAVAGLGGGIGGSVLFTGNFEDPAVVFKGLDSMGGWAQLKFKPRPNLEINGALGIDNPFAGELRRYTANSFYLDSFVRNMSPTINFIYRVRSDVLFSTEYHHLKTYQLDNGSTSAHHLNLSVGYIF